MMRPGVPAEVIALVNTRSRGRCEGRVIAAGCTLRGEHRHHRQYRSRGGEHTAQNLIVLCMRCHEWVHQNGAKAKELGLAVGAYSDPNDVPVLYRGSVWRLLDAHGGLQAVGISAC